MMIPPLVRLGPPPSPESLPHPRTELVVLTERRGWTIVRWDRYSRALVDEDTTIPQHLRLIDPDSVRCWMRQDGT